jgi:hypothetical protein
MFTDVKKETQKKFDVTILTQVVIGILNLWNSTYRPHQPIVHKIRYIFWPLIGEGVFQKLAKKNPCKCF